MPMTDDGDIVRGLGYVTLYAAYMEEAVEECLAVVMRRDTTSPKGIERWPISERIKHLQNKLAEVTLTEELDGLLGTLSTVVELLKLRNEVVHGRIYGGLQGEKDELRPSRPDGSVKAISSAELYDLANSMSAALAPLNHASMFALARLP